MPFTFTSTGGSGEGTPGKDSLFLGTWNSVTEFLAAYQGGPVGLADGDWWAFVKDNANPNKIYVVREDPLSTTGWVIDDNEHFVLPQGPQGDPGSPGLVYLGNYVSGNGYIANIAVVKGSDNNLYIATSSGGLGDPVGNSAEWSIFLPKGVDGEDAPLGTGANGEVTRWTPNFQATGLAFTGSDTTYPTYNSYYVKNGRMVSFNIEVDLSTVTNFGTGQYKLQLPFTPQFGFNHFSGWAWADPDVSPDTGTGHTIINADTAGVTDVLDLHYLKSAGGANAPIREGLFVQGTPVTLTTISKIYINGTYITNS